MVEGIGTGAQAIFPGAMPLDEATRRLAFLLQRDLRRLEEREHGRSERGEEIRFDSAARMATWQNKRGEVLGRLFAREVARYVIRDRILRWAWATRATIESTNHAEVVAQEGEARGAPQLAMSVVGDLDEDEALELARLGIVVARGEGLEIRRTNEDVQFIGLFSSSRPEADEPAEAARPAEDPAARPLRGNSPSPYSVPPPAVARRSSAPVRSISSPPVAPYRSLPPIREVYELRSSRTPGPPKVEPETKKIREPARSIFLPVATGVLAALLKAVPGFQQALFVITVDTSAAATEKRRLVVLLVANDATGVLRAIDPSREIVEAAAAMVEADRADGNGPWRKLSARILPKADGGATLNVDVV